LTFVETAGTAGRGARAAPLLLRCAPKQNACAPADAWYFTPRFLQNGLPAALPGVRPVAAPALAVVRVVASPDARSDTDTTKQRENLRPIMGPLPHP
jgi:hypothetical protein